ncbi:MAG: asparagine synthase (glutamine-hydrolyzing) [Chloroflexi bacterium]|nr:asparagine synthase (glutamine-hydrolyzing) [Chloroflexota bacterium]
MCGICGIWQPDQTVDESLVRAMNGTLTHRGPDGDGLHASGNIGLAMRRLAIIDVAGSDQPIYNEDRSIVLVFNGEIYNYRELRANLLASGHALRTQGDGETIVHLYEEHGVECVTHLNGIFAFALWDVRRQLLLLARDHLGIKPMHYMGLPDGGIVFGSELKALIQHPAMPKSIDPVAVAEYFALRYIPSPRTIYSGVRKLPPAHRLVAHGADVRIERYWDWQAPSGPATGNTHYSEALRPLFEDVVRRQMLADVPLGAFLSGGIDSTIVVGLMAQVSSQPVKTYSVGFEWNEGAYYDETPYARAVAKRYGTDHHEVVLKADALDLWPRLAAHFDEPFADPASIPTFLISQFARKSVRVVLTGEGADELFAGYGWYAWAQRRIPLPFAARLAAWALDGRRGKRSAMARFAPDFETMYFESALCSVFQSDERDALFSRDFRATLNNWRPLREFAGALSKSRQADPQTRMQDLDARIWLEGGPLTKVDRMSMATSIEARVPFLDYRMVELAARMPPGVKLRNGVSKAILRETFADLLPPEILNRPKHAFDVPIGVWLRGGLRQAMSALAEHPAIAQSGYFDPAFVQRVASAHLGGRDHAAQLWALWTWCLWWDSR